MINNDSTRSPKDCFATVLKCATDLLIDAASDFIGVGAIKDCVKAGAEALAEFSDVTTVTAEAVTGGGKVKEAEITQAVKPSEHGCGYGRHPYQLWSGDHQCDSGQQSA